MLHKIYYILMTIVSVALILFGIAIFTGCSSSSSDVIKTSHQAVAKPDTSTTIQESEDPFWDTPDGMTD